MLILFVDPLHLLGAETMKTKIDRSTNPPTLILVTETRISLSKLQDFSDAKKRSQERGSHYFDADTIRYFRARFHAETTLDDGSLLIVESTKRTGFGLADGAREYRVMRVTVEGEINHFYGLEASRTFSGIPEKEIYSTAAKATRAMYKIADRFQNASKKERLTSAVGGGL